MGGSVQTSYKFFSMFKAVNKNATKKKHTHNLHLSLSLFCIYIQNTLVLSFSSISFHPVIEHYPTLSLFLFFLATLIHCTPINKSFCGFFLFFFCSFTLYNLNFKRLIFISNENFLNLDHLIWNHQSATYNNYTFIKKRD